MISRSAVRAFLARELDDFLWLKKLPKEFLLREAARINKGTGFTFKTDPWECQLASYVVGTALDEFLFLLDMGTGKTKVCLDILGYRKAVGTADKMLVCVPNTINLDGWSTEVETHSDLLPCLLDGKVDRWEAIASDADVCVITYASLLHMVCKKQRKRGGGGNKLAPNDRLIKRLASAFDIVVLDEIHSAKNPKSVTFRVCKKLASLCPVCFGLTGTPFGREPEDLWGEFNIIDGGETLGETLGLFRAAFYTEKRSWGGWREYEFKKRMKGTLYRMLRNKSIRYSDTECTDLPRLTSTVVPVRWSDEAYAYQQRLEEGEETGHVFHLQRMITAGFIQTPDKVVVRFKTNPKVDALRTLIESMPAERKMVVFHVYVETGKMIAEMLRGLKLPYASANGSVRDPIKEIRRFKADPECRVLVANAASAGTGGNFQAANYLTFAESPPSPIQRQQALKRVHRAGQMRPVHLYDLAMLGSVDYRVLRFIEEGKDLFSEIIEGRAPAIEEVRLGL